MTLLMVWTNKPGNATALNIAADSRLSNGQVKWDCGTKIHRIYPTSTWLAYCGDSFNALSAITSATAAIANSDHLSKTGAGGEQPTIAARVAAIRNHLDGMFTTLPKSWQAPATLVLADFDHRLGTFSAFTIDVSSAGVEQEKPLDIIGKRVHCFGSGAKEAEDCIADLRISDTVTTKNLVGVLTEVINGSDNTVGGPPQMVMLSKTKQQPVGFWWPAEKGHRHLFGVPMKFSSPMKAVKWMTPAFEERPYRINRRVDAP